MGKKGGKKKAGIAEALPPAPVAHAPAPEIPPFEPEPELEPPVEDYLPREELLAESETLEEAVFRNEYSSRTRSPSPAPRKASPSPSPSPLPHRPPPPPVNGISSPALSALVDHGEDDPGYDTRAWARNIPFGLSPPAAGLSPRDSPANHTPSTAALGTSPSAPPFSLAASPPAVTTDRSRPPPGEDVKGGFSGASPALSPRPAYRLPARQSIDNYSLSVSPRGRPMSMQQYPGTGPRPQAHLRGLSEAEIGMMPSRSASGKRESSPLTLFDQAYYDGHIGDVIINASGSALQILRLEREKLTVLGTLSALRGSVLAARMLPPSGEKTFEPIIVLIVHGPMLVSDNFEGGDRDMDTLGAKPVLSTTESQTTVEVYNLRSSRHLATLYKSPPVSLGNRATHPSLTNPASAVGSLAIHVSGSFVTVTSGQSGEVYIFKGLNREHQYSFVCLGKTWTSMPPGRTRSYSVSSTSSMSTVSHEDPAGTQTAPEVGIVSLSHRWLAVVPPPASSQTSLQGEVGVPGKTQREPPGLLSHTSPAQPSSNCEADTPLDEGLINKMARDAAQEAMKGAKRASEAGYQAFRNYWNKNDASPTEQANYNPYGGQASSFPPTHAQDHMQRPSPSVTLVSIIDLERLYESLDNRPGMLVQPIATFPVRYGCSFVSFNPTGLSLFTSSAKGDVSYVWCLMRMIHGVVATPQGDVSQADNHASVRQVARYSRFTTSHIVDVIWTKPKGEKLAILTEKGTVHIHDLPASAFRWPPPVRHTSPASTPGPSSETSQQTARGRFSDAISFVQGTAQSFSTARLRSSLTGANFKDLATTAGVRGGRIVAAGISKSVGAASGTMSNIRHMGENRISLPGGRKARIVAGTVALLSSKYQDAITITGDGVIKLHAIRLSVADGGKGKRSVAGELISQISVPKLDDMASTVVGLDGSTARGQWVPDTSAQSVRPGQAQPQPLSFAEIETSTPHRPFHTDRHVSMHGFADDAVMGNDDISDDWIFGDDIETYPLGEDQLPAASSHHGDRSERTGSNFEATFAFDEESAPGGHARSSGQPKPSAQKSARSAAPSMDNYDDLINIQQDIEAAGMSSELGSVRGREGRAAHHHVDEEEEEVMLPFGGGSEFGL